MAEGPTTLEGTAGAAVEGARSPQAETTPLESAGEATVESGEAHEGSSQTQQDDESRMDGPAALTSFVAQGSASLEKEAATAAQGSFENAGAEADTSRPPLIQRSLWSDIKGVVGQGAAWISQHVIRPIQEMASSAWSAINALGGRLADAYRQANANGWDILQSDYLLFRILRNLRRQMYRETIQQQEREQARAVAEGRLTPEAAAEPTLLERADAVAEAMEGAGETVFEVKKEIVEGAVLGDFKENPTIWNTIGQIAMGFVPYAGQVADIRDLIASIIKLCKGGWKDPWEWFNLVLVVVGIIPGIGDAIKAGGRAAKGAIRRGVRWVMGHAGRLWGAIARRVPGMLRGAARFGRRLLQGAAGLGRRLLHGAPRPGAACCRCCPRGRSRSTPADWSRKRHGQTTGFGHRRPGAQHRQRRTQAGRTGGWSNQRSSTARAECGHRPDRSWRSPCPPADRRRQAGYRKPHAPSCRCLAPRNQFPGR